MSDAGKGDGYRKVDRGKFERGMDRIYGKRCRFHPDQKLPCKKCKEREK